jgi:hypothetical protein
MLSAFAVLCSTSVNAAGRGPRLHEPLYFDLVRGLGAHAGELEMNTLVTEELGAQGVETRWAPEVELAVLDGLALELELPHVEDELQAIKGAVQLTLPAPSHIRHGVQILEEHSLVLAQSEEKLSGLYLIGTGSGRFSALLLAGAQGWLDQDGESSLHSLSNLSFFCELGKQSVLGLETDLRLGEAGLESLRVLPQFHQSFGNHIALQLGLGLAARVDQIAPFASTRLIVQ